MCSGINIKETRREYASPSIKKFYSEKKEGGSLNCIFKGVIYVYFHRDG